MFGSGTCPQRASSSSSWTGKVGQRVRSELAYSTATVVVVFVVVVVVVIVVVVVVVEWASTTNAVVVADGFSSRTVPVRLATCFGLRRPRRTARDRHVVTASTVDGPRIPRRSLRPSDGRPGPSPSRRLRHRLHGRRPDDDDGRRRDRRNPAAGRASPRPLRIHRGRGDPVPRTRRPTVVPVGDAAAVRPRAHVSSALVVRPLSLQSCSRPTPCRATPPSSNDATVATTVADRSLRNRSRLRRCRR